MCLSKVTSTTQRKDAHGFGWKVFEITPNGLMAWLRTSAFYYSKRKGYSQKGYSQKVLPKNKWLKSYDITRGEHYPKGFHIFTKREAAQGFMDYRCYRNNYKVEKVEYRNVLATGWEAGREVIVAKEMRIL